jgi:hypothetical protein
LESIEEELRQIEKEKPTLEKLSLMLTLLTAKMNQTESLKDSSNEAKILLKLVKRKLDDINYYYALLKKEELPQHYKEKLEKDFEENNFELFYSTDGKIIIKHNKMVKISNVFTNNYIKTIIIWNRKTKKLISIEQEIGDMPGGKNIDVQDLNLKNNKALRNFMQHIGLTWNR